MNRFYTTVLIFFLFPLTSQAILKSILFNFGKPNISRSHLNQSAVKEESKKVFSELGGLYTQNSYSENVCQIIGLIKKIETSEINKPISGTTFLLNFITNSKHFNPIYSENIVQELLAKGANSSYNPACDQKKPLWIAFLQGNTGAFKALLSEIEKNSVKDDLKKLHLSICYNGEILEMLQVICLALKKTKELENYYIEKLDLIKKTERNIYDCQATYKNNDKARIYDQIYKTNQFREQLEKIEGLLVSRYFPEKTSSKVNEETIIKFLNENIEIFSSCSGKNKN